MCYFVSVTILHALLHSFFQLGDIVAAHGPIRDSSWIQTQEKQQLGRCNAMRYVEQSQCTDFHLEWFLVSQCGMLFTGESLQHFKMGGGTGSSLTEPFSLRINFILPVGHDQWFIALGDPYLPSSLHPRLSKISLNYNKVLYSKYRNWASLWTRPSNSRHIHASPTQLLHTSSYWGLGFADDWNI